MDRLVESLIFSFSIFSAFSLCQELQGYVVVRVADQIGGGLETGCMIWTGANSARTVCFAILFVLLSCHILSCFVPSVVLLCPLTLSLSPSLFLS